MTGIYSRGNNLERCEFDIKIPYLSGIMRLRNKLRGNAYLVPVQGVRNIAPGEKHCH